MSAHRDNDTGIDMFELGLQAFRQERGTAEQRRELERRLIAVLGPDALDAKVEAAAAPSVKGAGPFGPLLMMPILAIVGAALLASLLEDGTRGHETLRPEIVPTVPVTAAVEPNALPEVTPSAPQPSPQIAPAQAGPRTPEPQRPARKRPPVVRPRESVVAAPAIAQAPREDELTLMQRARSALRNDSAGALAITDQHARDYPKGTFVQEREVLAINALLRQRRTAEAFARAERFLAAHAGSSYAVQLRAMLANKPLTGAAGLRQSERIEP